MLAYVMTPGSGAWKAVSVNTLEDMQKQVGGYIEAVPVDPEGRFSIYVNEEGKLTGLAPTAVWLYDGKPYDVLCGPILLLGPLDEDGDDTPAFEYMCKLAAKHIWPFANCLPR